MGQPTTPPNRDVMQEQQGDYRTYGVQGSPAHIGRQMARHHQGPDGPRLDELSEEQISFARLCAREVQRTHAPMLQELSSWAGACNLPLDEALFYFSVGMTETSRRGRSRKDPTPAESAAGPDHVAPSCDDATRRSCSTVGVLTRDGPVIGRNFDLYYRVKVRHLVTTDPDGYLSHTGMYDGLVAGRTDGMNQAGLFASLHTVRAHPPGRRKPGLFCVHIVRAVLETCRTAKEAADRIEAMPQGVAPLASNAGRQEASTRIASLMADHTVPVCWHTETMSTLWSAVASPATGRLEYALGAPCRTSYVSPSACQEG